MGGVRPIGPSRLSEPDSRAWFSAATRETTTWVGSLDKPTLEHLYRFLAGNRKNSELSELMEHIGEMDAFVGSIEAPLQRAYFCVSYLPKSVYLSTEAVVLPNPHRVSIEDFKDGIDAFAEVCKAKGIATVQLDCGLQSLFLGYKLKQIGISSIPFSSGSF